MGGSCRPHSSAACSHLGLPYTSKAAVFIRVDMGSSSPPAGCAELLPSGVNPARQACSVMAKRRLRMPDLHFSCCLPKLVI